MSVIKFPKKLNNSIRSFDFLINLHNDLIDIRNDEIILEFTNTKWIDADMCSPLGAILEDIKKNKNSILIRNPNQPIKKFFISNSFVKLYQQPNENYINSNIRYALISQVHISV